MGWHPTWITGFLLLSLVQTQVSNRLQQALFRWQETLAWVQESNNLRVIFTKQFYKDKCEIRNMGASNPLRPFQFQMIYLIMNQVFSPQNIRTIQQMHLTISQESKRTFCIACFASPLVKNLNIFIVQQHKRKTTNMSCLLIPSSHVLS